MIDKAAKDAELIEDIVRLIEKCDWDSNVTLTLTDIAALLTSHGYKIHEVHTDNNAL